MKQSPTISNSISFRRSLVRRQRTRQPGAKQNEFGRVDISRERVLPRPPADLPSLPNATCAAAFGGAGLTLAEWRDAEEQLEQKLAQIKLTNGGNKIPASWAWPPARWDPDSQWFPALDITQMPEEYLIEIDLPGLTPKDIEVTAEAGILSLEGARPPLPHGGRSLRVERPSGYFIRRLALPEDAQFVAMTTAFSNGIMQLRVPRNLLKEASPQNNRPGQ